MKVLLYGRFGQYPAEIEEIVKKAGLAIVDKDPETVITYGGDGTLLGAERDFPDVPKLPLKGSSICSKCYPLPNDVLVKLLVEGKLHIREYPKLEIIFQDKKLLAVNDVVIRNAIPNNALRFSISTHSNLQPAPTELIGDGVVVASAFGSTGYFYSITRETFETGLGLAFNNIHNAEIRSEILSAESKIEVKILRGPGVLAIDNDPQIIALADGDLVNASLSSQTSKILTP